MKKIQTIIILVISFVHLGCDSDKLVWTAINVNSDIRQGDAHLISKNGKYFLIDTGHSFYAKNTLIPYLKAKKIKTIDAILISHPHNDHYGGVKELINHFIINSIYMNFPTKEMMDREYWGGNYGELLEIKELAKKNNIEIVPIIQGEKLIFDKRSFIEILYVYDGINTPIGKTDINDMSAIAMLNDGKNRFLFTGDLNQGLGKYLSENAKNIKADILKAPHHGTESLAPNSFFSKVSPKVLIVPSPKHLWLSKRSQRLREFAKLNGYKTYINGIHGNITVTSDGSTFSIKTEY